MKKISMTWLFAVVTILALLIIHRLSYEFISNHGRAHDLSALSGLPFRFLSCILLISCLLTSFLLPSLQLFLVRKEMNEGTLVSLFLGSLIGPISILIMVTMVVHDLDGGLLLILAVIAAPIITLFTLGILCLVSRNFPTRTSKGT